MGVSSVSCSQNWCQTKAQVKMGSFILVSDSENVCTFYSIRIWGCKTPPVALLATANLKICSNPVCKF